jgi:general secretion pathway protein F
MMASFRYRAITTAGAVTTGLVAADTQAEAVLRIREMGHLPMTTAPAGGTSWRRLLPTLQTGPSQTQIAFAAQELAALLGARLPLDRALSILVELDETRSLRAPFAAVLKSVRDGAGLADAFQATGVFSKFFVTMVRAGEMGGGLDSTLKRLADYLARASAVRQTVVSALMYPAVLLCTTVLSIVFILLFVLPEFAPLFAQSGKPLPFATAVALAASNFLRTYWWAVGISAAVFFLLARRAFSAASSRQRWDRLVLKLPFVGPLILKTELERFSRTLSTLLANGVALPPALMIVRDTLSNQVIASAVEETAASLKEGEPLAVRMRQTGVFPSLVLDMVLVGEQTGSLDEMLLKQADFYELEVKHGIDRLLALLVPVLTVVMGMIVAGLIASILLAILSINDLAT